MLGIPYYTLYLWYIPIVAVDCVIYRPAKWYYYILTSTIVHNIRIVMVPRVKFVKTNMVHLFIEIWPADPHRAEKWTPKEIYTRKTRAKYVVIIIIIAIYMYTIYLHILCMGYCTVRSDHYSKNRKTSVVIPAVKINLENFLNTGALHYTMNDIILCIW